MQWTSKEGLDWVSFSARHFPETRRHNLEAVAAYGAYKQGRDWHSSGAETTPPKLTLVPSESASAAIVTESESAAGQRLLAAIAAETWEGEGGFSAH